jgi:serine/threonine protein kinase
MEIFNIKKNIGKGSFGRVFQGTDYKGREFAVKKLDKKVLDQETLRYVRMEIETMADLFHRNIVKCFFSFENEESVFIFIEMCPGGDLESYLKKHTPKKRNIRRWVKGLLEGLNYLHSKNIMHRDLKLANFLLSSQDEDQADLKLADFGFSKKLEFGITDTQLGSPLFMAPEIFKNDNYTLKADIWSLGSSLFELFLGRPLYNCTTLPDLMRAHLEEVKLEDLKLSSHYKDLILRCLSLNPNDRPTCEELLQMTCFSDQFEKLEDSIENEDLEETYDFLLPEDQDPKKFQKKEENQESIMQGDLNQSEYYEDYEEIAFSAVTAEIELMIFETLKQNLQDYHSDLALCSSISNFFLKNHQRFDFHLKKIQDEFGDRCLNDSHLKVLLKTLLSFQEFTESISNPVNSLDFNYLSLNPFQSYCMSFLTE